MTSNRIAQFAATALTAAALGLAAFATATGASASSVDEEFLTNIDNADIAFSTAAGAIEDAHLVCAYLADGQTGTDIGTEIMSNSDLTAHQAATFVVEAASAYCPRYVGQLAG